MLSTISCGAGAAAGGLNHSSIPASPFVLAGLLHGYYDRPRNSSAGPPVEAIFSKFLRGRVGGEFASGRRMGGERSERSGARPAGGRGAGWYLTATCRVVERKVLGAVNAKVLPQPTRRASCPPQKAVRR